MGIFIYVKKEIKHQPIANDVRGTPKILEYHEHIIINNLVWLVWIVE